MREALTTRKERRLPKPSKDSKGAPAVQFTVVEELAVGALAGIASRFFTTPLSNVTVRKQTSATSSGKKAEKGGKDEKQPPADSESDSDADDSYSDEPGTIEIMRQIVQDKGVWGTYSPAYDIGSAESAKWVRAICYRLRICAVNESAEVAL